MLIIQILLILVGLYIIRLYLPPLVSLGVINAGNLFGFAGGGAIVLLGVLLRVIVTFIRGEIECNHKKQVVIALTVICTLALAFLIAFFGTLGSIIHHAGYTATDQSTVIVLGIGDGALKCLQNNTGRTATRELQNVKGLVHGLTANQVGNQATLLSRQAHTANDCSSFHLITP